MSHLQRALEYHNHGLTAIPVPVGAKKPPYRWRDWRVEPQTESETARLFSHERPVNVAVLGGASSDNAAFLEIDDPRTLGRLELLTPRDVESLSASLGPEPLSPGFTPEALRAIVRDCRQPAKLFLLDQKRIAG